MEQVADLPEDSWQHVVCRICSHPFAVAIEEGQGAAVVLCQTCSILVEWFGQKEAPPAPLSSPQPARAVEVPKRAKHAPRQQRQRAELAALLDRWGELWRTSEEYEEQL